MMFKLSGSLSHAHWDHLHADPASCWHGATWCLGWLRNITICPAHFPGPVRRQCGTICDGYQLLRSTIFTASRWKLSAKKASAQQPKRALACTGTVKTITVNDKRRMGSASPIICSHHHWSSTDAWIYSYCVMKPRIEFTFPDAQMILRCIHFWPIYSTHLCMLC